VGQNELTTETVKPNHRLQATVGGLESMCRRVGRSPPRLNRSVRLRPVGNNGSRTNADQTLATSVLAIALLVACLPVTARESPLPDRASS